MKEKNKMGAYKQASEAWKGFECGERFTAKQLRENLGLDETARRTVGSFLSRRIRRGDAIKDGSLNGLVIYKKVAPAEAREREPRREEREISDREIGEAVLKIIDDLKTQLTDERATVKQLVEENKQLKQIYEQAQTKILELNTEIQRRAPNRGVKLSELQDLTK